MTALKAGELKQWKKDSGYHQRSIAETAMYRFKQLIGPTLSLRNYNAQVGEILGKVIGIAEQRKIASAAAISPEPFTTIHDEEQALAPDAKARQVTLI